MGQITKSKQYMSFGGMVTFYSHESDSTKTPMNFSVYHPPQEYKVKVPVLFWLSGLTCNEENFITKAGAQMWASHHG
ncbi:MAG: alpha/beta hydrolase-fold protein, partial [Thermodesulfobacteriota bacterium]